MHIVHGELRKPPFIKNGCGQDQQSTMFIIELSEVVKDFRTGEKTYTNYSAVLFAKSQAHINHLSNTLVEGNFVVVTGDKLKVDVSESNGRQYIKLQIENASLEGSGYIESNQGAQQPGGFQQQAPAQQPAYKQAPPAQQGFQQQQTGGFQQNEPGYGQSHGFQGGNQQMPPK